FRYRNHPPGLWIYLAKPRMQFLAYSWTPQCPGSPQETLPHHHPCHDHELHRWLVTLRIRRDGRVHATSGPCASLAKHASIQVPPAGGIGCTTHLSRGYIPGAREGYGPDCFRGGRG